MSDNQEKNFDAEDIEKNKTISALAYFLFFLPLIASKDSKFGRFHANQGLVLLLTSIAGAIVVGILNAILIGISWRMFAITGIISTVWWIIILVLAVLGIVNTVNGKAEELPVIGKFSIIK